VRAVIVFVHGNPETGALWDGVRSHLDRPSMAVDLPGFGTPRPDGFGATKDEYVEWLVGELDRIGEPVDLVGHDWGAVVGWELAATRPELLRTFTAVSVPHPAAFVQALLTSEQGLRSWYVLAFQVPWLPERLARQAGGLVEEQLQRGGMSIVEVARFRREIVEYGALPGALAWYRALLLSDPRATRRRISVPTTFVWSDGDVAVTRAAAERCEQYVDGPYRFEVLEGVTHWIPTQAPTALAGLVLDRVGSRT